MAEWLTRLFDSNGFPDFFCHVVCPPEYLCIFSNAGYGQYRSVVKWDTACLYPVSFNGRYCIADFKENQIAYIPDASICRLVYA